MGSERAGEARRGEEPWKGKKEKRQEERTCGKKGGEGSEGEEEKTLGSGEDVRERRRGQGAERMAEAKAQRPALQGGGGGRG